MDLLKAPRVFLADDDADDRLLFEDAISEIAESAEIVTARDGHGLMQLLNTKVPPNPSMIFLDLNMPRKNGFECLTEIKKHPAYKDIPVVIFSTTTDAESIDRVYNQGASFYLPKPSSFPLLKKALRHVFSINWDKFSAPVTKDKFVIEVKS